MRQKTREEYETANQTDHQDLATERDPGNPKLLLASPPHTRCSSLGELMACSLLELQGDATTSLTKQALKSWTLGVRLGDPKGHAA